MLYTIAKAIHVVGFISWFAGLFYVVRLFVYHAEANECPEAEREILQRQYVLMAGRLWKIITVPAMVVTILAGATMVSELEGIAMWLRIKLVLLVVLVGYHHACGRIRCPAAVSSSRRCCASRSRSTPRCSGTCTTPCASTAASPCGSAASATRRGR